MVANTGALSMGVSMSTVSTTTTTFTSMPAVDAEGLRQDPSTDPTRLDHKSLNYLPRGGHL